MRSRNSIERISISVARQQTRSTEHLVSLLPLDSLYFGRHQKLYEEYSVIMSSTNAASAVGIISSDGEALTTSAIVAAEAMTGSHVLQIKGYSITTKELGNGKHIKSSTFSVGGHRWYIRYYPDGNALENAG